MKPSIYMVASVPSSGWLEIEPEFFTFTGGFFSYVSSTGVGFDI